MIIETNKTTGTYSKAKEILKHDRCQRNSESRNGRVFFFFFFFFFGGGGGCSRLHAFISFAEVVAIQ